MTVGANSYGAATDVGALTPRYLATGVFSTATRPTLAQVEAWIDQTSAVLNVALSLNGFHVPITQADAVLACKGVVAGFVADLAHFANSAGRFYSEKALDKGISPWKSLYTEMNDWVASMAAGLEQLGAARDHSLLDGLLYKEDTTPIFQVGNFGNNFADIHGTGDAD